VWTNVEMDRQTDGRRKDIMKLIVKVFVKLVGDIRKFAKAPKRETSNSFGVIVWTVTV